VGLDFAYLFAMLGTFVYVYALTFDTRMIGFLSHYKFSVYLDFFPAFFLFINGFTISLSLRNSRVSVRKVLSLINRRGLILLVLGLLLCRVWNMNLLVLCGAMYVLAGLIARWNNNVIMVIIILFMSAGHAMLMLGVPTSVTFVAPHVEKGIFMMLRFVFFNGYFSILPWCIFFLGGLLLGREDVRPRGIFPPSSIFGFLLIGLAFVAEKYFNLYDADFNPYSRINPAFLNVKFAMSGFVFFGMGSSIVALNLLNYFFRKGSGEKIDIWVQQISSTKYSAIFLHALLGFLMLKISNVHFFNPLPIRITMIVISIPLIFVGLIYWKKKVNKIGPVEFVIKRISDPNKK